MCIIIAVHFSVCNIEKLGGWEGFPSPLSREKERFLSLLIVTYPRVMFNPLNDGVIAAQSYYDSDIVLNERGRGILVDCGRS